MSTCVPRHVWKSDTVTVHYVGKLTNGRIFDSSRDRRLPFSFELGIGQVIQGWDQGIPQFSVGQKANLTITPDLAYANRGYPPNIPPGATLVFEIELLRIS
ncbi:peptidyl-prolyl cis-trans isomerase [Calocera cornea HHB12733]|uniref:peptidylprolyl isomerase n=1 Tax=Calocera cornea HHB12733 TaxID=1353952 RepID=A0A165IC96_9BASI|nr:peptidyl-prolyl cis-trans isomerase [Calocera cornea HHB12733]